MSTRVCAPANFVYDIQDDAEEISEILRLFAGMVTACLFMSVRDIQWSSHVSCMRLRPVVRHMLSGELMRIVKWYNVGRDPVGLAGIL